MGEFDKLQFRKATEAEWTSVNPVLLRGEPAWSYDTGDLRIGNGVDHWADLTPVGGGVSDHGALSGLADDDHPLYQDEDEVIALATPIATAEAAAAVGTHASDPDAHGDFLTEVEADALYDALGAATTAEANAISTAEAYTDDERDDHEADFDHSNMHARSHAINSGSDHTGTLDDSQIPAGITRDAEAAAAYAPIAEPIAAAHIIDNTAPHSHDDLGGVSADDHHAQSHGNADHTSTFITGITVQEEDSTVVTGVTTLDFDGSDFNITDDTGGEARIGLAYGTGAGTPAEGSHTHTGDASVPQFGSGVDGAAVLDGTNRYPWCTLSGTTYTCISGYVMLTSLTISSGITLRPLGCVIAVQGTLDNSGTISWDGNAAVAASAGASEASIGPLGATIAGGAGRTNSALSGLAGTGHTSQSGLGGVGGYGGAGTTALVGGVPGAASRPVANTGGLQQWDAGAAAGMLLIGQQSGTFRTPQGGGGGGGGAGAASGTSGGGGAGGGIIYIAARTIVNQASGIISVKGGAGAAGTGTGPVGGGAGGGGGSIYLVYHSLTNTGSITAAGGVGGAGSGTFVEGDAGTGSAGTASDTDGTYFTHTGNIAAGQYYLLAVMSTVSAGTPEVPTFRLRNSVQEPGANRAEIDQLATVTNGTQRLTVYIARPTDTVNNSYVWEAVFAATQTSCDIMIVAVSVTAVGLYGWSPGGLPVIQTATNTATASTTCVVTLAAEQADSITFGFFSVAANVTITAGAGFTGGTALTNAAPAGQLRHEALAGQDTTVDATTVAGQNWCGIAVELQQGKRGSDGAAGRVVQITV